MGAIAMRIRGRRNRPAAQQMLDLIQRQGSGGAAFLPGVPLASGAHWLGGASSSPTPGMLGLDGITRATIPWLSAYVESTASTPAAVDGPVGFLSDGDGALGSPIAITNGGLTVNATGWTQVNSPGLSFGANGVTITKTGASDAQLLQAITTVVGNWYLVIGFISNATNNYIFGADAGNTGYRAVNGWVRVVFKATSTTSYITLQQGGATGASSTFGQISVQNLTGRHATQNSGPNKPTMRKGLVNLLTFSNDLTNTAWAKSSASAGSASTLIEDSTLNSHLASQTFPMPAGVPCTYAAVVQAGLRTFCEMRIQNGSGAAGVDVNLTTGTISNAGLNWGTSFTNIAASVAPYGSGWLVSLNATCSLANPSAMVLLSNILGATNYTGNGASSIVVSGQGAFAGTLTAQQILAAGGIPQTATVAASSSGGNYALEFNGSTSGLLLPSVHLQMSDDFYIGWLARCDLATGYPTLFSELDSTTNNKINLFYAGGVPAVEVVSASGGSFTAIGQASRVGQYVVISGRKLNGVLSLNVNGALERSGSLSGLVPVTLTSSAVGMWANGAANWFKGSQGGGLVIRGAVSDAERMVFDRGLAALCPIPGALRF